MNEIQQAANKVWALPHGVRSKSITDVVWDIYLFDGKTHRHDYGPGMPDDVGADLEHVVRQIATVYN